MATATSAAATAAAGPVALSPEGEKVLLKELKNLPTFSGKPYENVEDWFFSITLHLDARSIVGKDEKMVKYLSTLLTGPALVWWRTLFRTPAQPQDIDAFATALRTTFAVINPVKTARDQLARLRQRKSVREYAAIFRQLTLSIPGITDDEKKDRFVRGLKPRVMQAVVMKDPDTFAEAVQMAERYDTIAFELVRNSNTYRDAVASSSRGDNHNNSQHEGPTPMDLGTVAAIRQQQASTSRNPYGNGQRQFTKLTPELRQQLIREGKCLYCRKPGHIAINCPNKQGATSPNAQRQ